MSHGPSLDILLEMTRRIMSILALLLGFIPHLGTAAVFFRITELGTLGGSQSLAGAISDSKRVVGSARLAGDAGIHTFLYRRGTIRDLSPLNSQEIVSGSFPAINNAGIAASGLVVNGVYVPAIYNTRSGKTTLLGALSTAAPFGINGVALGISDSGAVVGYSYISDGTRHAFLWTEGTMHDLGSFGGYSVAEAVNNWGAVVGFSSTSRFGSARAFLYENGFMADISPEGSAESFAVDINDDGKVIGTGLVPSGDALHGFVFSGGLVTDLGVLPNGQSSSPFAINNRAQIVGTADAPIRIDRVEDPFTGETRDVTVYGPRAFLYERGVMVDLNTRVAGIGDWDLQYAYDINNSGQILGYGMLAGNLRAFLLDSVHVR